MRQSMEFIKMLELKQVVDDVFYGKKGLDVFTDEDKPRLQSLANDGDIHTICILIDGMNKKVHSWVETFIDENTKKEVEVLRIETIDGTTFVMEDEEEVKLIQTLLSFKESMSNKDLQIACRLPFDVTPLLLERIRRGDEQTASYIDDSQLLQSLSEKGNRYASYELYYKYRWGDEKQGFFINKDKARDYYDMAGDAVPEGEEWDDIDNPGEEHPEPFCYEISGKWVKAVSSLIDYLCKLAGTPNNELGLFIPQQLLMKTLVGSDSIYYRGNVISKTIEPDGRLILKTEADNGEYLLYALREAFPEIEVEMRL